MYCKEVPDSKIINIGVNLNAVATFFCIVTVFDVKPVLTTDKNLICRTDVPPGAGKTVVVVIEVILPSTDDGVNLVGDISTYEIE